MWGGISSHAAGVPSAAPMCFACGHPHEQGVRCGICGHTGKANAYRKIRLRAELSRGVRVIHLNHTCSSYGSEATGRPTSSAAIPSNNSNSQHSLPRNTAAYMAICMELRRRVFCSSGSSSTSTSGMPVSEEEEFSERNNHFVYSLAFAGTAPCCIVRWRMAGTTLSIQACGVLPEHRNKGVMKATLLNIIQTCTSARPDLKFVEIYMPGNSDWMVHKCVNSGVCIAYELLDARSLPDAERPSWCLTRCILTIQ